jgi:hypothetical protein
MFRQMFLIPKHAYNAYQEQKNSDKSAVGGGRQNASQINNTDVRSGGTVTINQNCPPGSGNRHEQNGSPPPWNGTDEPTGEPPPPRETTPPTTLSPHNAFVRIDESAEKVEEKNSGEKGEISEAPPSIDSVPNLDQFKEYLSGVEKNIVDLLHDMIKRSEHLNETSIELSEKERTQYIAEYQEVRVALKEETSKAIADIGSRALESQTTRDRLTETLFDGLADRIELTVRDNNEHTARQFSEQQILLKEMNEIMVSSMRRVNYDARGKVEYENNIALKIKQLKSYFQDYFEKITEAQSHHANENITSWNGRLLGIQNDLELIGKNQSNRLLKEIRTENESWKKHFASLYKDTVTFERGIWQDRLIKMEGEMVERDRSNAAKISQEIRAIVRPMVAELKSNYVELHEKNILVWGEKFDRIALHVEQKALNMEDNSGAQVTALVKFVGATKTDVIEMEMDGVETEEEKTISTETPSQVKFDSKLNKKDLIATDEDLDSEAEAETEPKDKTLSNIFSASASAAAAAAAAAAKKKEDLEIKSTKKSLEKKQIDAELEAEAVEVAKKQMKDQRKKSMAKMAAKFNPYIALTDLTPKQKKGILKVTESKMEQEKIVLGKRSRIVDILPSRRTADNSPEGKKERASSYSQSRGRSRSPTKNKTRSRSPPELRRSTRSRSKAYPKTRREELDRQAELEKKKENEKKEKREEKKKEKEKLKKRETRRENVAEDLARELQAKRTRENNKRLKNKRGKQLHDKRAKDGYDSEDEDGDKTMK